jgi:hypothetical protein
VTAFSMNGPFNGSIGFPTVIEASRVVFNSAYGAVGHDAIASGNINYAFGPSSPFVVQGHDIVAFQVTGATVPEPSSMGLFGIALLWVLSSRYTSRPTFKGQDKDVG